MDQKVAFVTGASRGIGRAVALHLASSGWNLWLAATSSAGLDAVATEARALGADVIADALDITDSAALDGAIARALAYFDRIDLLLNNAAVNFRGTMELPPEEFRRTLEVNVTGAWNVLRAVVPKFREQRAGHIINISSVAGLTGFAGGGAYCSSKFALHGLSESLHRELTPLGIKVTALCPSWTNTDMASYAPFEREKMIPTDDLCRAIDFLVSLSSNSTLKELVIGCASDPL